MADLENQNAAMNRESRQDQRGSDQKRGEKRLHHRSVESTCSSKSSKSSKSNEPETDETVLNRRQNQIDLMKNTTAYDNYTQAVPKESRAFYLPRTPNKYKQYSRRQWDGLVKAWKLQIHAWNAEGAASSPEKDVKFPVVEEWNNDEKAEEEKDDESSDSKYRKRTERSFDYSWCEVLDDSD